MDTQLIARVGRRLVHHPAAARVWMWLVWISVFTIQVRFFLLSTVEPVFHRDEANDVFTATQPFGRLLHHFFTDWVPYTYLLVLRVWISAWGRGETDVRALSLLCVAGATWLVYRGFTRWLGKPLPALLGAVLVGLSPVVLFYPVIDFGRPYALSLLLAAWTFERWVVLLESPSPAGWLLFGLACAGLVNIQPVNLGFAATLALLGFLARFRPREWRVLSNWKHAMVMPVLVGVCALPTVIQVLRFGSGQGDETAGGGGAAYFARMCIHHLAFVWPGAPGLLGYALDDDAQGGVRRLALELPVELQILILLTLGLAAIRALRLEEGRDLRRLAATALLFALPSFYLAAAGIMNARMLVSWKCYSGVALGAALLLAWVLRRSRTLTVALICIALLRTATAYPVFAATKNGKRSDAKAAAAYLETHAGTNDLIVLANIALSSPFACYFHGQVEQLHHPYDRPAPVWHASDIWRALDEPGRTETIASSIESAGRQGRSVWLVSGVVRVGEQPLDTWHKWYSPEAFQVYTGVLERAFLRAGEASFTETPEPYYVWQYTPRPPAAEDEHHHDEPHP